MLAYLTVFVANSRSCPLKPVPLICACLLTVALVTGCSAEPAKDVPPLLKINDRQISRAEFEAVFARTLKPGQTLAREERLDLARAFLTQLVDRELTQAEARRRGLTVTPEEVARALEEHRRDYPPGGFEAMLTERGLTLAEWQAELVQSLTQDKLAIQVVGDRARAGAMEIDSYYAEHHAEFDRPEQVRARQIMVATLAEGEAVLARLRKGLPFAAAAREFSLSPEAAQGGDLGFFGRDEMPPEFAAVFDLPVGKQSPLITSDYGYHVFLVEEKRPAARLSRQAAEQEIRAQLEEARRETLYQEWLQTLRGAAKVEIDWRQLETNP